MSSCAFALFLNRHSESSSFRAERLKANGKHKFNLQNKVIEPVEMTFYATNSLPTFDEILELVEIFPQRTTEYWNERKFIVSIRQGTRTGGNSFTTFDGTLELAEIRPQQTTERWNLRKFLASVRRDTGTGGNFSTAHDGVLERAEICCQRSTRRENLRKLSQCDALLTSQGVALLTEFSYGKLARGVGKAQKIAVIICFINNRRRGRWEKIE